MVKNIKIRQVCSEALACEPLLERTANGELLCVTQCGGVREPDPENRVYVYHSKDDGETWSKPESIYPEDGQAVYATELMVEGEEITTFLTVHSGLFLDWKCFMMKSFDNGYTWKNYGTPPYFPEYTFIRGLYRTRDGRFLLPYQNYPVTREAHDRTLKEHKEWGVFGTRPDYCESGVLESYDRGVTYIKHMACRLDMTPEYVWSEPTLAELSDGSIAMLMRKDGSGVLYRCDSSDGGRTWGEAYQTDIPNPSNKPRLIPLEDGRFALLHTPCERGKRYPLALWISDDDLKSWCYKTVVTEFPGSYSYTDGFYEDGHIRFVIEHNRHTVLYFDVELEK